MLLDAVYTADFSGVDVVFGEQVAFHKLDEDMQDIDMQFLHAVREGAARQSRR
jgi:hypothetical protein